jgi:hypothetical protein
VSNTALRLEKQQIPDTTVFIYCDRSAGKPQKCVPASLRLQVFQPIHDLSHPATAQLIVQRFVWPGIQKRCLTWARACQAYQRSKISRHTVTPVGDFTLPTARFHHVHIDFVGPFPTSAGYTYCPTEVDRFTHWPEVIPISDSTADTVAPALLAGWMSRWGHQVLGYFDVDMRKDNNTNIS